MTIEVILGGVYAAIFIGETDLLALPLIVLPPPWIPSRGIEESRLDPGWFLRH
jgi:hypothetical protein